VHPKLGPGLFETVYEVVLAHELRKKKLLVESKVIVELKSVECLTRLHAKQLLTQLRLANVKLGLLINFGAEHLKDGIKRIINGILEPEEPPEFSL
jgi:hypothetical protein